jgi:hypothetical protein
MLPALGFYAPKCDPTRRFRPIAQQPGWGVVIGLRRGSVELNRDGGAGLIIWQLGLGLRL